uniref:Uncharacterized protein n=1 Tax=Sphingobacterium sp. (strain 21) TaxID=743722 RepID=F4C6W8_SPHS2
MDPPFNRNYPPSYLLLCLFNQFVYGFFKLVSTGLVTAGPPTNGGLDDLCFYVISTYNELGLYRKLLSS